MSKDALRTRPHAFWTSQRVGWRVLRWGVFLLWLAVTAGLIGSLVFATLFGGVVEPDGSPCEIDARSLRVAQDNFHASHGVYATEKELVREGLLSAESSLHDINLGPGNGTYTLLVADRLCNAPGRTDGR